MKMNIDNSLKPSLITGAFIFFGLIGMAAVLGYSALEFKGYERVVTVKGLSEKEVPADVAVWVIRFSEASDDLSEIYASIDRTQSKIINYLVKKGFSQNEISIATPSVTDKLAQQYGDASKAGLRYTAMLGLTVRSSNIDLVRATMKSISELGKTGIVFGGMEYQTPPEFIYTKLNSIKPVMIEEATRSAREVAAKFASDSQSKLGKIRTASQGQFTVEDLDASTPHIKKVRVVSTVEFYLSD